MSKSRSSSRMTRAEAAKHLGISRARLDRLVKQVGGKRGGQAALLGPWPVLLSPRKQKFGPGKARGPRGSRG